LLYQLSQEGNLSQRQIAVLLGCDQSTTGASIKKESKFPRMLSTKVQHKLRVRLAEKTENNPLKK